MSFDSTCFHCTKDERLQEFMIEICKLEASTLYLFREQTLKGRCVLSYHKHVADLFQLEEKERELYTKDLAKAAAAINKAFSPDRINYGAYSDKLLHLHFHIVPKYEGQHTWGATFEMMPQNKVLLSDEEYAEIINKIKQNL